MNAVASRWQTHVCIREAAGMAQAQVASSKAHAYTVGVEIECFLPETAIQLSIGIEN
jgi:hypothetical protein